MTVRTWSGPALNVIGLGLAGETLAHEARRALQDAELVIGAPRHFEAVERAGLSLPDRAPFPSPFSALWQLLETHQGKCIALLASGDPLFYGLGGHLRRHLAAEQLRFYPAVSSVQAAFSRIGQPWQEAEVISLHGRPLISLRASLRHNRWYAALTDACSYPAAIAAELVAAGFAESPVWVAEDLGSPDERITQHQAGVLGNSTTCFSPLNVVIFKTKGPGGVLPEFPGIADTAFSSDGESAGRGLLTKREVRLCILSMIDPRAGDIGWDVGAGCGGVAVEWARWNAQGHVHAVEYHSERLTHLATNRDRFGVVKNLHTHEGRAPDMLAGLPSPTVVFVGGGGRDLSAILNACWARLPSGGRLIASAVTEEARLALHLFDQTETSTDAEWIQLAVSRGDRLAGQRLMRPQLPVLLFKRVKP
ncbi:precorrin-6Y C5,15-methyltransferase (decarboxylating) [Pseudomonas duriflava]|uniref:Precorrin-6Y C5,15-methyltransferase (Decarboxylating) n=1 Tax=Pseudomonas duriflava TaxID=459528 RepID=A0A562Q4P1_9PSED|nr:precorrin-6y C5,15-methyltransferase (decarboxylating) subunit CbiE [Pseudomonas duriflava]TWI50986.1 precorrin-6Y C5,15-methyltransferase (decarboxylating) [Pseudomonas duriflava]